MRIPNGSSFTVTADDAPVDLLATLQPLNIVQAAARPENPVICDGKLTAAQTPLMSMSLTRASAS